MSNPYSSELPSTSEPGELRPGAGVDWPLAGRSLGDWLRPFILSVLAIAITIWLAFRFDLNILTGGFLFLIIVVFSAAFGGFWSGTLTSLVAAACMDYFFLPPIFHWDINDPMDWVALGTFEFTALVITLLQDRVQRKAAEAAAARQGSERLYNAARGILSLNKTGELGNRIAALIREEFGLRGVVLFDAPTAAVFASGECPPPAAQGVRDAFFKNADASDPDTQTRFCVLRSGSRPVGGLALCGGVMPGMVAQAIASLCALTLERARSLKRRHGPRPPGRPKNSAPPWWKLWRTRSRPLSASSRWQAPPCRRWASFPSRKPNWWLPSIPKPPNWMTWSPAFWAPPSWASARIEPHLEPVRLSDLLKAAIQSVEDQAQRARFQVSLEGEEKPALADGKLMLIAFTQLIDNAIKYSIPRSPIAVRISTDPGEISVFVHNQGGVIAPADRERIFERFYRTAEARQGPVGTGLGLSIARRIVDAHRGYIGVESGRAEGTTFRVALPRAMRDGREILPVQEAPGGKV